MKKSEIIKGVSKLYKDQFLTMATPGSGSWNLYQIPTGYALLKSKEGDMFYGEGNICNTSSGCIRQIDACLFSNKIHIYNITGNRKKHKANY